MHDATPSGDALLLTRPGLERIQAGLRERGLEGWLLYEFHAQNPIAWSLLGLTWTTRRSFVLIPAEGEPVALIHAIEHSSWRDWPWETRDYSGWRAMESGLADLLEGYGRLAMEYSEASSVPTLEYVPAGIIELVRKAGVEPVGSGDLVSMFHSRWTEEQAEGHRAASVIVAETARTAFERAAMAVRAEEPLRESELADWIRGELARRGLHEGVDCIVAIGPRAADPHYNPGETGGEVIERGQVLLIDLWGKFEEDDVPADQTWMGYLGSALPERVQEVWETVRDARDAAVTFLTERHAAGEPIRGYEVDDACRKVIVDRGYGDYFVHRTGHSIDRDLHGSGPNLDNLETRDDRLIIPGVGFSVEPGIYLKDDLGIRSELNVFWSESGPEVTTPNLQDEVFLLLDD